MKLGGGVLIVILVLSGCSSLQVYSGPSGESWTVCRGVVDAELHDCIARVKGGAVADWWGADLGCKGRGERLIARAPRNRYERIYAECASLEEVSAAVHARAGTSSPSTSNSKPQVAVVPKPKQRDFTQYDDLRRAEPAPKVAVPKIDPNLPKVPGLLRTTVYLPPISRDRARKLGFSDSKNAFAFHYKHLGKTQSLGDMLRTGERKGMGVASLGNPLKLVYPPNPQCMVMINEEGAPIEIRADEEGIDRFAFYPFLRLAQIEAARFDKSVTAAVKDLEITKSKLPNLEKALQTQSAWKGNQCIKPQRRRIPARPSIPSDEEIRLNAHGQCFLMHDAAFQQRMTESALTANGRLDIVLDAKNWVQSGKMLDCARGEFQNDPDRTLCRTSSIFGDWGVDARNECITNQVKKCVSAVTARCTKPLSDWQSVRRRIIAEPDQKLEACQRAEEALRFNIAKAPNVEKKIASAKARQAKAHSDAGELMEMDFMPFSDKRTYCQKQ